MPDPVIWQVIRVNKIFSEFIKLGLVQQFGNIVIIIIEAAFHREHLSSPAREGWCEAMSQYREIWIERGDMRYGDWIRIQLNQSGQAE